MRVEFRKRAAERAAEERRAAMERQKAIMEEKQEKLEEMIYNSFHKSILRAIKN